MRSDRFRVKLWRGPFVGRCWGVFFVRRSGRVSRNPTIISSTVAGALDALARKRLRKRTDEHDFSLSDVLARAKARNPVPRGFDH